MEPVGEEKGDDEVSSDALPAEDEQSADDADPAAEVEGADEELVVSEWPDPAKSGQG